MSKDLNPTIVRVLAVKLFTMLPNNFKNLNGEVLGPEDMNSYEKLMNFYTAFLVSEGEVGESDSHSTIQTYRLPKNKFNYDFRNVIKELPLIERNENTGKPMHIFSKFSYRYPVYSDYDCAGQLISKERGVEIFSDKYNYNWYVIITTNYSYDL